MGFKARVETKRTVSKALAFLLVFFISSHTFTLVQASNSPPSLSKGTVTPRKGYPGIDYLFTVTYTDADNDAPSDIRVFIDQLDYVMEEVDPTDVNYTDSKEYTFKKELAEGSYSIYFSANDGNGSIVSTNSFTLSVTWDVGHYDIIHFIEEKVFPGLMILLSIVFVLLLLLCLISIFMVLQLRKIAEGLEGEKEEGEEGLEGERKDDSTKKDVQDKTQTQ